METIKGTLFIVILMTALNAYGQHRSSPKTQKGDLQLGVFYSYDQNISRDNIALSSESGYRNEYDQFNFTAGLTATYYISNPWAVRLGLSYSNRNFRGRYYNNAYAYAGRGPQKEKIRLPFIQVPMAIRFYPYSNKFSVFAELGLLNQLMIDKPNVYQLRGNTYALSGIVGAGVVYHVSHGFSVRLSGKYTRGLSKIFKGADYPYRIVGVQLGLTKKL